MGLDGEEMVSLFLVGLEVVLSMLVLLEAGRSVGAGKV